MNTDQLRVFSCGFGVQSVAAMVLAAHGTIDYQTFLFANVGNDSENPATLEYIRDHALPYAAAHGLTVVALRRVKRDGTMPTLLEQVVNEKRSVSIPLRMAGSGAPGNRTCTSDYKIKVIEKWLKAHGATKKAPALVGLGISMDEFQRMRTHAPGTSVQQLDYPLITLRLNRADCVRIIQEAGLPIPPKSACWFCPYKSGVAWRRLKADQPDLFAQSVALEVLVNERRAGLGRDPMWLSSALIPLDQAIAGDQSEMDMDSCESGYCHT